MTTNSVSGNPPVALIVDDDPVIRMTMRAALANVGFKVFEAENGLEGLVVYKRARPDLVLLDVVMPEMDGFETCRAIRATPDGDLVQILVVTGLDDSRSTEMAFEAGADGFLSKPINVVMLGHKAKYMMRAARAFQEISKAKSRLEKTQDLARLGHWEFNLLTNQFTCSLKARKLLCLPEDVSLNYENFFSTVVAEDLRHVKSILNEAIGEKKSFQLSYRVQPARGEVRFILNQGDIHYSERGTPVSLLCIVQDISMQRLAEEEIRKLAFYDSMTGLANRLLFVNRVEQEISAAKRKDRQFALLCLDLDQFKRINETLGHSIGDKFLQKIAKALKSCVEKLDLDESDGGMDVERMIARIGGDEFTVIVRNIYDPDQVVTIAKAILQSIPRPYDIDGYEITVTASMGISIYPADGESAEALLKSADTATSKAKNSGRNNYQFYQKGLNARAMERYALEKDVARAIQNNEFVLYYQPKIELATGRIVGAEALIRWLHEERGMVSPARFIPVAEESGQIVAINSWVIETACSQWSTWCRDGIYPGVIAVNISGYQFTQHNVIQSVGTALQRSGLAPELLEIEITENILMDNLQEAISVLQELKKKNIRITLDDFGTGYSSLSYLASFQVDTIKVDRSFVTNSTVLPKSQEVIKAIIAMGHSLGVTVVAEGVETQEQLSLVRELGVDEAQGYYFAKPVPAGSFLTMLDTLRK